ncbi:MAG: amidohydrolase family protein, partial [Lentisphaeria bacterium]|nr:amidohydrolase family protein [Lentisphaeria bacterium]
AFGFDSGVIAVGKDADALLIDLEAPEMIGDYDLVSNLVYAASNRVIDTVICSGKVLMENGVVPGEKEIIASARKVCDKLRK